MNNGLFFSFFKTKYSKDNTDHQRETFIKLFNQDYYNHLSDFYIQNTEDISKSFKKYKKFEHIKVISRRDVYDLLINQTKDTNKDETKDKDTQVDLLNYYHSGFISKQEFLNNFNSSEAFLTKCIPWNEFLYNFTYNCQKTNEKSHKVDLLTLLKSLQQNIETKPFDYKEYHNANKRAKIGIIMNYFIHPHH